jgi:hypothetical protein
MSVALGRLFLNTALAWDSGHASAGAVACLGALLGGDAPPLPQAELCCDLRTMSLLEESIGERSLLTLLISTGPLAASWPSLGNTISFRLLSEKQFYTIYGDDTVTATVALASLSMVVSCTQSLLTYTQTSVREEDEDNLFEGNRKRTASVTGGAAALLKVCRIWPAQFLYEMLVIL